MDSGRSITIESISKKCQIQRLVRRHRPSTSTPHSPWSESRFSGTRGSPWPLATLRVFTVQPTSLTASYGQSELQGDFACSPLHVDKQGPDRHLRRWFLDMAGRPASLSPPPWRLHAAMSASRGLRSLQSYYTNSYISSMSPAGITQRLSRRKSGKPSEWNTTARWTSQASFAPRHPYPTRIRFAPPTKTHCHRCQMAPFRLKKASFPNLCSAKSDLIRHRVTRISLA